MAFTGTTVTKTIVGNLRLAAVSCTADALSGAVVAGGINKVLFASICPISMATAGITVIYNQNAAGSSIGGSIHLSGCTSGDAFFLTVFGT